MKRLFAPALLALLTLLAPSALSAGTPIASADLPTAAQTFLAKHFAGDDVRKAEKDHEGRTIDYEVDLASGAEIDFFENGEWREVKAAHGQAVPAAIVPAAIARYVADNHADRYITEISHKRGGYEVELSDGTELKLTADGQPMTAHKGGKAGKSGKRR